MGKTVTLKISEARDKLTQLDKLISPEDVLQITRRGKPFAAIRLIKDEDPYEHVLNLIDNLPENKEDQKNVAENYKHLLYSQKEPGVDKNE